jgi:putative redox protein
MTQVVVVSDTNLRHQVWAGQHTVLVDEPVTLGGDDTGPSPYELILAALGTCTSMTLLLYARRKGWTLEHVEIRLEHNRVYREDCERCEEKDRFLDHVNKHIVVSGALSPEQVQRLGEIAEKCPVNKTPTTECIPRRRSGWRAREA